MIKIIGWLIIEVCFIIIMICLIKLYEMWHYPKTE